MDNRVRSGFMGLLVLTLLTLSLPVFIFVSTRVGGAQDPLLKIPVSIALYVSLFFALILLPGLLVSWHRWRNGRPGILFPVASGLGIAGLLLCLDLTLWQELEEPPKGFLPQGIEVHKPSILDLIHGSWHRASVQVGLQRVRVGDALALRPPVDERTLPQGLCIREVQVWNGLLHVKRQLGLDPELALRQEESVPDVLAHCEQTRRDYLAAHGKLEHALLKEEASRDELRRYFPDNLARDGQLAILGQELPEPWRGDFADLHFNYGTPLREPVLLFDLALLLADPDLIDFTFPVDGPLPYQRYALAQLDLQEKVAQRIPSNNRSRRSASPFSTVDPLDLPGDYQDVDFLFANTACDPDYASWLIQQGVTPTDTVAQDLLLILFPLETSGRSRDMEELLSRRKQLDCTALAALYGDQPEPFAVTHAAATARVLAEQLGELSLKGYQSVAEKALAALTPEERADDERVDALYRDLSFTAKEFPVPAVFPAYAAMYAKHYSYAAACSTLTYAPWAVFHPEITDVYRQLWSAWKDQRPDNAGASLEKSCRLPLLNPSGLYAPQTALRNELLELAGLPCRIHLEPRGQRSTQSVMECRQ